MSVYIVQAGDTPRFKIGFTGNSALRRVATLQVGCPDPLRLVAEYEHLTADDEKRIHGWLDATSIRGEWFRLAPHRLLWLRGRLELLNLGRDLVSAALEDEPICVDQPERICAGKTQVTVVRFDDSKVWGGAAR